MAELKSVQALRAAACLMVVAYHALQAGAGEAAIAAWPNLSAGVDVFFVVSGFVMVAASPELAGRPDPARRFLARRALRIVPLYWLLTAAKLVLALGLPGLALATAPTVWNVVASFLFIPSRNALGVVRPVLPVGWTLEFEVFFYALFAGALAARRPVWWVVAPLLVAAAAGFARRPDWPAPCFLLNGMVLEFAGGMGLAWAMRRGWLPRRAWAGLACAAGFAGLLTLPLAGPWRFLVWGGPAAVLLAGALGAEAVCARLPRWLLGVGDASYAIYLVHPFLVPAVGAWLAMPLSVLAGLFMDRFADRPLRRMFSQPKSAGVWGAARPPIFP